MFTVHYVVQERQKRFLAIIRIILEKFLRRRDRDYFKLETAHSLVRNVVE